MRTYLAVEDIQQEVKKAEDSGATTDFGKASAPLPDSPTAPAGVLRFAVLGRQRGLLRLCIPGLC